MLLTFIVPGNPIPKARPRLGRGRRAFTPQRTLDYEALVREAGRAAVPEGWFTDGEYDVSVICFFDTKRHGDLDNPAKVLDGLNPKDVRKKRKVVSRETPFIWEDDKQVKRLTVERFYVDENPHLRVTITACPNPNPPKRSTRKASASPSADTSAKVSRKRTSSRLRKSGSSSSSRKARHALAASLHFSTSAP